MNKTTHAFKLAEEALLGSGYYDTTQQRKALAAIREALADHIAASGKVIAEPVEQEPVVYYAYATIKEYEELAGFSVSQAFRAGWNMARTTNSMLGINAAPVDAKAIRAEALEEAAKVCEKAMIQMNYSEAPYKQCAAAIRGLK